MKIRRPTFSAQPPIDAYGDGGFRIQEQRVEGSILLTPRGLYPWPVRSMDDLDKETLAPIASASADFELLLIGCGPQIVRPSKEVRAALATLQIHGDFMDTGAAARTYNVLLAEDRLVTAALIAV